MQFQPVYLVAIKNVGPFLETLRHAQAPEKVSIRFVEELGFKSTNDRLFVPLLKAMKFIDDGGKPTARYHQFLDDAEWKRVLADGIREAYSDLFRINRNAHTFTREQLTGKLRSLGEGKLSPSVLGNTSKTFLELVKLADFGGGLQGVPSHPEPAREPEPVSSSSDAGTPSGEPPTGALAASQSAPSLVYRIEIILPAVRDQAVYDAIFRSAREHLLK